MKPWHILWVSLYNKALVFKLQNKDVFKMLPSPLPPSSNKRGCINLASVLKFKHIYVGFCCMGSTCLCGFLSEFLNRPPSPWQPVDQAWNINNFPRKLIDLCSSKCLIFDPQSVPFIRKMSKNTLGFDLCAMSNVVLRVGQSFETGFEQRRRRDEEKAAGFIVLLIRHNFTLLISKLVPSHPVGDLL